MSNSFVILWTTARLAPLSMGCPRWLSGKQSAWNSGDAGSIPGLWRSLEKEIYFLLPLIIYIYIINLLLFFLQGYQIIYVWPAFSSLMLIQFLTPLILYFHSALLVFLSPVLHASHCVLSGVPFLWIHADVLSVMDSFSSSALFLSWVSFHFPLLLHWLFLELSCLTNEFFHWGYYLISFWNLQQ